MINFIKGVFRFIGAILCLVIIIIGALGAEISKPRRIK